MNNYKFLSNKSQRTFKQTLLYVAVASAFGAMSSHALAQASAQTNPPNDEGELEHIEVTSTKRLTNLQDIPSSISSLSKSNIERQGLDDYESIARSLPGVTLNQLIRNRSFFNIRGIATAVGGGNTQDPVSVYINDVPITDTFGASVQPDLRLYDVERVEVLRGPQGTLFGSGSLGGTVRVITNKASFDGFDSSVRIDLANTKGAGLRQRYDAMVNVPLVEDELALRVVGYAREEEGWVDNVVLGTDNGTSDKGGRISLKWQASENLLTTFEILHQDSDPEDGDAWDPTIGKFKKSSSIGEGRPSKLTSYNATIEYDIEGFATLVSSTSYNQSKTAVRIDYGDITGLGFPLLAYNEPWEVDFLSQELRLVSNANSELEWVVGGFFIDRESNADFKFILPGLADFINTNVMEGLLEDDNFLTTSTKSQSQEVAIFGELNYHLSEKWTATLGLRGSNVEVSINEPERAVLNFATFSKDVVSFNNQGKDNGVITWKAALSYQPTSDLHLYGNVSKGYRIGQTNPFVGASPVDPNDPLIIPNLYEPDETLNYEFGVKTDFWDNKARLNLAAYYIDWSNIQIDALRLSDVANYIANAGEAVSKGLEIELQLRPIKDLELNMAMAFQNAEIVNINEQDSLRSGVVEGDELPGSVDFQFSGSAQYYWSLEGGNEMYARITAQYTDSSPNAFSQVAGTTDLNPFFQQNDAYENIDASLGLILDNWEITLYGENLTNNDDYILNVEGTSSNYISTLRPRTFGARAHYRF